MEIADRIEEKERRDRELTIAVLKAHFGNDYFKEIRGTRITDWVDVVGRARHTFAIEVKDENARQYDTYLLRKTKLERMLEYYETNDIDRLYFVALESNINRLYLYDINRLDFGTIGSRKIKQRKTQFDENSEMIEEETYLIPKDKAILKLDYKCLQ